MIRAYRRSRMAYGVVLGVSVLVVVLLWVRDRNYPIVVPVIASILALLLGLVAAQLLGNVLANMETTRCLGYLHMELDPKKFLAAYGEVPDRAKPNSESAAVARSYLADGYWADGQFQKALSTLKELPQNSSPALRGLYASARCAYCLAMGDLPAAHSAIDELSSLIKISSTENPVLSQNLAVNLRLYQEQMDCLTGKQVNLRLMQQDFKGAQYNIRRLEIAQLLAQTFLRDTQPDQAMTHLEYLSAQGGKTFFRDWAEQQLAQLAEK